MLFGVSDSGRIVGQHCSDASRRELAEALRRIEPSAQATIDEERCRGMGTSECLLCGCHLGRD